MEPDELNDLLEDHDAVYSLDNVMLNMDGGGGGAVQAQAGRGRARPRPDPLSYMDPQQAMAMLRGAPPPDPDDEFADYDTSCDELEEDGDPLGGGANDDDDDDDAAASGWGPRVHELNDGRAAPPPNPNPNQVRREQDDAIDDLYSPSAARAEASSRVMDRLARGGGGGGGDGGGEAGRRRRASISRMECFGCTWTSRDRAKVDKHLSQDKINRMNRIFSDLLGHADEWPLAKMMHMFFKNEIYYPLLEKRRECMLRGDWRGAPGELKMWRTKNILVHFKRHQLDPRVTTKHLIDEYRCMSAALYQCSFAQTEGGSGVEPVRENMAMKARVDQQMMRFYKERPENLNFHNPDLNIDFRVMGMAMGPYRQFSIAPE